MTRRTVWVGLFLGVTALAVGGELWAAFDDSSSTVPWTELLTDLPWWIVMPAAVTLSVWLPLHLWAWYRRRARRPAGAIPAASSRPGSRLVTLSEEYDMTTGPAVVPPSTAADARNRAFRTFVQGLFVDLVASVALAVGPALADAHFAWTGAYWATVGLLAVKTGVQTVVSYAARHVLPPAV